MTHTLVYGVVAIILFATISFWHLRSIWLAIAIAIGPIPGPLMGRWIKAFAFRDDIEIATFCFVMFELIAAAHVQRLVRSSKLAASNDNVAKLDIFLLCLALMLFAVSRFSLVTSSAEVGIIFTASFSLGSSGAILLVAVQAFKPGENLISIINREQERSERFLEVISPVVSPRWGFSVFGMALVLLAIAFFAASMTSILAEHKMLFAVLAAVMVALALFFARDWRRTLATIFSAVWLVGMETWASSFHRTILRDAALTIYVFTLAAALVPILVMAGQHRRFSRAIGTAAEAAVQTIFALGRPIIFTMAGASVFLGVWWIGGFLPLWPAVTLVAAGVASLLIYPATAAVLESLFLRRRPAHERYRLK
jgi:hypothetical protein